LVFTFILAIFYFESRKKVSDFFGRSPSYLEFVIILYKIFLALNLVLKIEKFIVLGVCVGFVGILLVRITSFNPYYNRESAKIFLVIFSLNGWSLLCLTVAGFVEHTDTQHFSLILLVGAPFIVHQSVMYESNKKLAILSESRHQFKTDLAYYFQIEYFIQLASEQYFSPKKKKFIIGILQDHKDECMDDQCPCGRDESMYDILSDGFHDPKDKQNEDTLFLKYLIRKLYEDALFHHENSECLHLSFAMFLFDYMRNRHMAFYQLSLVDKAKPSLPMQFAVFRERKVLDEDIQKQHLHRSGKRRLTNTVDITQVLKFDRYCLDFQSIIEKTSLAYIDFWNRLSEAQPEIKKLDSCGTKLEERLHELNILWAKMNKINPNSVKLLTMYALFLVNVKNCDQEGAELLSKIRYLESKQTISTENEAEFLFAEDCAMITISVLHEQLSKIVSVSKSVGAQYGYSQPEIVGHSVTLLMPSTIGRVHDDFIINFINTGQEKIINRIRNLYAIHRQGFTFPVKIVVKPLPSVEEDVKYVGFTRPVETRDQIILVDQRGIIDSISYDLTIQLRLPLNFFKNNFVSLKYFVKELLDKDISHGHTFFSTNWTPDSVFDLTLTIPKEFQSKIKNCDDEISKYLSNIGFSSNENQSSSNMNGLNSVNRTNFFQELTEFLENAEQRNDKKVNAASNELLHTIRNKMDFSEPADTFNYRCKAIFVSLPGCQLHALHLSQKASEVGSTIHPEEDENIKKSQASKQNFGLLARSDKNPYDHQFVSPNPRESGIKRIGESEERYILREQLNGDSGLKKDLFEELCQTGGESDRRNSDKDSITSGTDNKKILNVVKRSILDTKNIPPVIRKLNLSSQAVFFFSILIASVLFGTQIALYQELNQKIEVLNKNTYLQQSTIRVGIRVRIMDLVNRGKYALTQDQTSGIAAMRGSLEELVPVLQKDQEAVTRWRFNNDPNADYFETDDVNLVYRSTNNELSYYKFNLVSAMLQIISQAYTIAMGAPGGVKEETNEAAFFLLHNCFNDGYMVLDKSAHQFLGDITDRKAKDTLIINYLLISTGGLAIFSGLVILLFILRVYRQRDVIMSLFLEIPTERYQALSVNCSKYLSYIQGIEHQEEDEFTQKKEEKKSRKNHRKNFKGSAGTDLKVFVELAGFIFIVAIYFVVLYFINDNFSSDLNQLIDEMKVFEEMQPLQSMLFYAHIDMLATNGTSLIEGIPSIIRTKQLLDEYEDLRQQYGKLSLQSASLHTSSYATLYDNLEYGNVCQHLDSPNFDFTECQQLASGMLERGLNPSASRYHRMLYNIYTDYKNSNKTQEILDHFLLSENLKTAQLLEEIYFFEAYRKLTEQLTEVIQNRFNEEIILSIGALIGYLIAIFLFYFFLWRSALKEMRYLLWKTKSWLGMLPIDFIQNTPKIRAYLLNYNPRKKL